MKKKTLDSSLKGFTFIRDARTFSADDALVARLSGIIQEPGVLFAALYEKLHLPGYFGFNWNALFDCLRDLHWVAQRRIVIAHEDLPLLPPLR